MVRRGYESFGSLIDGSRVFEPNEEKEPGIEAQRLLDMAPEPGSIWNRVTLVPVSLNAYAPHPKNRDFLTDAAWWVEFAEGLNADFAAVGTVTTNWVDQMIVLAAKADRSRAFQVGPGGQQIPAAIKNLLRSKGASTGFRPRLRLSENRHERENLSVLFRPILKRDESFEICLSPPGKLRDREGGKKHVLLALGTSDSARLYPSPKLIKAVQGSKIGRHPERFEVTLVQGPQDAVQNTELARGFHKAGIEVGIFEIEPDRLDLLADTMAAAALVVCNESFWVHLASAMGAPTVSLWGLGHWPRFLPVQGHVSVVHTAMPCAGCNWFCVFKERKCITGIDPNVIAMAVEQRLEPDGALEPTHLVESVSAVPDAKVLAAMRRRSWNLEQLALQAEGDRERLVADLSVIEDRLSAEVRARQTEAAEKEANASRLREADNRIRTEIEARESERTAKERLAKLLLDTEKRLATEEAARIEEVEAKSRARSELRTALDVSDRLVLQLNSEVTAHAQTCKARIEAEKSISRVESARAAEEAEKLRLRELLRGAEAQRDAERVAREAEAAAKARLSDIAAAAESERGAERVAREAEAAEKTRLNELLAMAEQQRETEIVSRLAEASAKDQALELLENAERALKGERHSRELEGRAKEDALRRAERAEIVQKETATLLETTVEANRKLKLQLSRLGTHADRLHAELIQSRYRRQLEAENKRQVEQARTWLGIWLRFKNTTARGCRRIYCLLRGKPMVPLLGSAGPRVTQVNTHDIIGGAERTSYDHHLQLRDRGLKPSLIVGGKFGEESDVYKIHFQEFDWKWALKWRDKWGFTEAFYAAPVLGCFKWDYLRQANIVHIHNMHGQYWSSAALLPLGMQHPVVLTLHDEYTLSGDCCYTYDCDRWKKSCGRCPQIGLERSARYALGEQDKTALNIRIKRLLLRAPRAFPLVVVTPSDWLADRARQAPNLRHLPIARIYNGVDLEFWRPESQSEARRELNLPNERTIGVVVASYLEDRRKGFDVALAAIRRLPPDTNLHFLIVGNLNDKISAQLEGLPVTCMGYVSEKTTMRRLFAAADFTFSMSRVDNLPYMCVESLACGRPVFGSAVGGIPEIINEPELGWLAEQQFDPDALGATLRSIEIETQEIRSGRQAACRRSAEIRFSLSMMTDRYLRLYEEMHLAAIENRGIDLTVLADVTS